MHGTVGDPHIHESAIILLVVQCIVFQTDCRTVVLGATGVVHGEGTAEQRVFTQVFVGSSACRDTLDIDGRSQDHVLAAQPCFMAHALSIGIGPLRTPGGCQCRTSREEGGRVGGQMGGVPRVGLHLLTDAEGTISIFHIRNPQPGDTFRREHVLAMEHGDLLFKGHVLNDGVNLILMSQKAALCQCGSG